MTHSKSNSFTKCGQVLKIMIFEESRKNIAYISEMLILRKVHLKDVLLGKPDVGFPPVSRKFGICILSDPRQFL